MACQLATLEFLEGTEIPLPQLAGTARENLRALSALLERASCEDLARIQAGTPDISTMIPTCHGATEPTVPVRGYATQRLLRLAQAPDGRFDERCHVLEERSTSENLISLSPSVVADSGYYGAGERFVQLGELDPNGTAEVALTEESTTPFGTAALRTASLFLGTRTGSDPTAESRPLGAHATSGYRQRVIRLQLAPGQRIRLRGAGYAAEVESLTLFGLVVGGSVAFEVVGQPDANPLARPIGRIYRPAPGGEALAWQVESAYPALSAHAFVGVRIDDWLIAPGVLVATTFGPPLQGVSLRVGRRFRSLSRSVYPALVVGLRWGESPRDLALYDPATPEAQLHREVAFAFSVGLEFAFDVLTVAGSGGGFVNGLFAK